VADVFLVCPRCHAALTVRPKALDCGSCGRSFPIENGIADFSEGNSYDRFEAGQRLTEREREGLEQEVPGAVSRIRDFYHPRLERERAAAGRALRVLDSGCGNGLSVDLLSEAGFEAWGADSSALRRWQWRERRHRDRLVSTDGARLPFPDRAFDAILCSGVLEHVGVEETGGERYTVKPLPDRDAKRIAFLAEHVRVLAPGGVLYLDFPNGAFPIDFWHGPRPGSARWHSRDEGFLPTAVDVRRYLEAVPGKFAVRTLGATGRLQFRQVGRHWYGRLLQLPAALWLRLLGSPLLAPARETLLNPFLVLEARRTH
jgi:SAM-dependent methyltransferase